MHWFTFISQVIILDKIFGLSFILRLYNIDDLSMIVSDYSEDLIKTCFLISGYHKKMMDSILDDVKRPRNLNYKVNDKNPPNQVLWIQAFGPSTKEIRTVVEEASLMLQKCPVWSKDNNPIGIVPRRAKNLGDMILKRKKLALTTSDYNPSNFIQKRSTLCILPARGANTGGGWGYSSPQRFRPSPQ